MFIWLSVAMEIFLIDIVLLNLLSAMFLNDALKVEFL